MTSTTALTTAGQPMVVNSGANDTAHDNSFHVALASLHNQSNLQSDICNTRDAVRDESRHLTDTIHKTAHDTDVAIERHGAANLLATREGELRMSKDLLKESCEIKALVLEENNKTRDLMRETETQRLRDKMADMRVKLACCECGPAAAVTAAR